jgi:hypothetical protein
MCQSLSTQSLFLYEQRHTKKNWTSDSLGKWSILKKLRISELVNLVLIHVHFCQYSKRFLVPKHTRFPKSIVHNTFSGEYNLKKELFTAKVHSLISDPYVAYCNYPGQNTWCVSAYLRSLYFCMCTRQMRWSWFTLLFSLKEQEYIYGVRNKVLARL